LSIGRDQFSGQDHLRGRSNGCGKSNLADAIRWSLGEQGPKSLRGSQMEDVIFHGADDAEGTGMAEVSICFDNGEKLCPPEYAGFTEIQVSRPAVPLRRERILHQPRALSPQGH